MAPPTKPTALKVLTGSAKHDPQRINRNEPHPPIGSEPPPFLPKSGPARDAWNRHYANLVPLRVLTKVDADALALGCVALEEYLTSRKDDGAWRRADSAWKRYAAMLAWFGLNPSARAKIQTVPVDAADPLEKWAEG